MIKPQKINKLVLATGNEGKVTELSAMLCGLDIEVLPQGEFITQEAEESGGTFVENAIIKARHAAKMSGLPAIADDSGLVVDSLEGAPGIYSARFAGPQASDQDNITKLLADMQDIPTHLRQAKFVCVLVFMRHEHDPTPLICQGVWQGQISQACHGENGFGYDPVFWLADLDCSSAQLTKQQKNTLSHRGQALQQLLSQLVG
jgi:XTP/dITP diphosphohydrolase